MNWTFIFWFVVALIFFAGYCKLVENFVHWLDMRCRRGNK